MDKSVKGLAVVRGEAEVIEGFGRLFVVLI